MSIWEQVVIIVPTMPERRPLLDQLLDRLAHECPEAVLLWRTHVAGTSPRIDFPEAVATALRAAELRQRMWIMQVEDDAWPAPDFGRLAAAALEHVDGLGVEALSLFSRSSRDLALLAAGERWRYQAPSSFCMMQAVAVRADVLTGLPDWAPSWYTAHPEHIHAADLLLGAWLSQQQTRMLVHIPSLVQHRAVRSTLAGHRGARQSCTYRAAFGEAR